MSTLTKALMMLRPQAKFAVRGEKIEWLDDVQTQPTSEEISAAVVTLQAEADKKANNDPILAEIAAEEAKQARAVREAMLLLLPAGAEKDRLKAIDDKIVAARGKLKK
jgi:hypothetical protein